MYIANLLTVAVLISVHGVCYAFKPRAFNSKSHSSVRGATTRLFSSTDDQNVVVVGGGVIGLSVALYLKNNDINNNLKVTLLEKETSLDARDDGPTTPHSMCHIRPKFGVGNSTVKLKLFEEANEMQVQWLNAMGYSDRIDDQNCAVPDEKTPFFEDSFLGLNKKNMEIERFSREKIRAEEPLLTEEFEEWLYFRKTIRYDADVLLRDLRRACTEAGVVLNLGEEWTVESLKINDAGDCAGVNLATDKEILGTVVLANGNSIGSLMQDFCSVPLKQVESCHFVMRSEKKPYLPFRISSTKVFIVPKPDGTVRVGDSGCFPSALGTSDPAVTLNNAKQLVPTIDTLDILETKVCPRVMTTDDIPIIGESKVAGLYLAGGFGGYGVTVAPYAARLVGHLILNNNDYTALSPTDIAMLISCRPTRTDAPDVFDEIMVMVF